MKLSHQVTFDGDFREFKGRSSLEEQEPEKELAYLMTLSISLENKHELF